jgi:hypothetical protein
VIATKSQTGNTRNQRRRAIFCAPCIAMSALGQKQTCAVQKAMSALVPIAKCAVQPSISALAKIERSHLSLWVTYKLLA